MHTRARLRTGTRARACTHTQERTHYKLNETESNLPRVSRCQLLLQQIVCRLLRAQAYVRACTHACTHAHAYAQANARYAHAHTRAHAVHRSDPTWRDLFFFCEVLSLFLDLMEACSLFQPSCQFVEATILSLLKFLMSTWGQLFHCMPVSVFNSLVHTPTDSARKVAG